MFRRLPGRAPGTGPVGRRRAKRVLDVVVGGGCLLLLGPLILVLAALVRATSPGPALFRQERVGQHGRRFTMYKLRTMHDGCGDAAHRSYVVRLWSGTAPRGERVGFKIDADPRVTRVGAVLRRTSLDELPQLVNVVRGDMSLVGPRPMLAWELELIEPRHRARFDVPAGMTGLWQVSGRSALTMRQALDLDVEYARAAGMGLDLRILARTAAVVLRPRDGAG